MGALYKLTDQGNVYFAWGNTKTPPGTANFTLSAQPDNQNNPNVDPQISTNVEVGSKWEFYGSRLSLTGAAFRTKNGNVIFTVDATAVPPIFNQDDAQRSRARAWASPGGSRDSSTSPRTSPISTPRTCRRTPNAGKRLTLTPAFSGSVWATYTTPIRLSVGGGLRVTDAVYVNAANTIKSPGYQIVDAMAIYGLTNQVSLRLNVYNRPTRPTSATSTTTPAATTRAPADGHAHCEFRVLRC